jgi:hypothetical protein
MRLEPAATAGETIAMIPIKNDAAISNFNFVFIIILT